MWGVKLVVFVHDSESIASICFARKTFLGLNGSHKTVESDDSSLNHSFVGAVLAKGIFSFNKNACIGFRIMKKKQ